MTTTPRTTTMTYTVMNSKNAMYDMEFTSRKKAEEYIAQMRLRNVEGRWTINRRVEDR